MSEKGVLTAARGAAAGDESRAVNIGIPPPDELRVLEARREAELKRLSEKLKRAEAANPQPEPVLVTPAWTTDIAVAPPVDLDRSQRSALGGSPEVRLSSRDLLPNDGRADGTRGRATILMVLAPRDDRRGYADHAADPILCMADGCYVSNGAQAPATYHSLHQSLSLGGRIGRGAGDCNHSLICVFRGVEIGTDMSMVQPIDLRAVRSDRREQTEITADSSCRVIDDRLSCSRPVRTSNYTLWVVPESLAREIGPERLTSAVNSGLRTSRTAELPWVKQ